MTEHNDFDDMPLFNQYPQKPGHKEQGGTSEEAANDIAPKVGRLQGDVLDQLRNHPATPDEVADILGESILSIRPRFSELVALGLIVKTDDTGVSSQGKKQRVFRIKD